MTVHMTHQINNDPDYLEFKCYDCTYHAVFDVAKGKMTRLDYGDTSVGHTGGMLEIGSPQRIKDEYQDDMNLRPFEEWWNGRS